MQFYYQGTEMLRHFCRHMHSAPGAMHLLFIFQQLANNNPRVKAAVNSRFCQTNQCRFRDKVISSRRGKE